MKIISILLFLLFFLNHKISSYAVSCQFTTESSITTKQIQVNQDSEALKYFKIAFEKIQTATKNPEIKNAAYAELINTKNNGVKKYYALFPADSFQHSKNTAKNELYLNSNTNENPDLKIIKQIATETLDKDTYYILNLYILTQESNYNEAHKYIKTNFNPYKSNKIKVKIYTANNTQMLQEKVQYKTNYAIIENSNKNDELYTFISTQEQFKIVKANMNDNINLFSISDALNRYTGSEQINYYLHVIVPKEATDVNSWFYDRNASHYKISQDGVIQNVGIKKYKVSEGEVHPVDIISIELKEARKQYKLYNSLMIKKEDQQNNKSVIYQLKFDKPSSFLEPKNIILDNNNGKHTFNKFKLAVNEIRSKISNVNETSFTGIENSKKEESRKKYINGLNYYSDSSRKTVAYATFEATKKATNLNNEYFLIPSEFYSISGSAIIFKNTDSSKKYFANYNYNNHKLPSFKVEDSNDFFKTEINQLQANLEKDKLIDGAAREIRSNQRDADAEIKILESFIEKTEKIGNKTEGRLVVYSSLPVCLSCKNAFNYFSRLRPAVKVEIFQVQPRNLKELYN